jgi:hypothetical protein
MKTSDNLTKLCQEASVLELEDQPIPSHWLVYGLMEAFGTQSSAHLVQIIRDAVAVKEKLIEFHEEAELLGHAASKVNDLVRRAHD